MLYISYGSNMNSDNLPYGFKWIKGDLAVEFTIPSNYNEEQARKIKFEKLSLLSEWVDRLPTGATQEYD